ncbi:MAG TPA: TraR/DksA C4-type zinc finger protein [Rhodothermales bacterium]|nr:TraR/DksA C4-type zinc finger protein [Rhodothermales bacterium]
MTDQELNHLRHRLEEMRDNLQTSLTQGDPTKVSIVPDNAIGRLTRMEAIQAQSMMAEGRRRHQSRLRQVELALERIARGQYGTCLNCGGEIPVARLEIMPESGLCMTCAARR